MIFPARAAGAAFEGMDGTDYRGACDAESPAMPTGCRYLGLVSHPSTFKRGFASTLGFNLAGRGMSALTLVVLIRSLDTSNFAFIVLLMSVGQFLGSAATGGIRLRYARLEAERISRGEPEPSAFHWSVISGTALVVAAGVLGFAGATALGLGKDEGERLAFVVLTTGFTLVTATVEMAIFHHQAQLAFTRAGIIEAVRSGIILLMACGAILGLFNSAIAVAVAFDLSVGIMALVITLPVAMSTRGATRGKDGRFGFGRETLTLTIYSVASAGWAYLDVFLVAALLDDVAVASYGAAIRYISVVMGPVPALIAVFRVRTSQRDMVDSEAARRRMMARWVRQTALPALGITGAATLGAIWIIPVIDGGRYPLSIPVFQILMIVAFVGYLLLPTPGLLIAQKRYTTLAWVNASALVVNVGVAIVAAPLMGVTGVAWAGAICGTMQAVTVAYLALRGRGEGRQEAGEVTPINSEVEADQGATTG